MPPIVRFLAERLLAVPITLLILTSLLYAITMLAPPVVRASLYFPKGGHGDSGPSAAYVARIIEEHGLDDPFPIQYGRWLVKMLRGDWGYSPLRQEDVLPALIRQTPATAELTLYSLLVFIPLGLAAGAVAGWRSGGVFDRAFRSAAFVAASLPPFGLGRMLLAVFYAGLHWLPPDRLGTAQQIAVHTPGFRAITGLYTVDGLLNGRPDIMLDALRHLALPVFCLSLLHWATVGRSTRAAVLDERAAEYPTAARARGLAEGTLLRRHVFPNVLAPALTGSALSAAGLVTGVYVIEVIFNIHGLSEMIVASMVAVPDTALAMGFAVYSILLVLLIMLALDLVQALVDPRLRSGLADI